MQRRAARAGDEAFLEGLFISVRREVMAPAGWPEAQLRPFLADQYRFQQRHYAVHYAGGMRDIVEQAGAPVGLLHLFTRENEVRVVDIALVPACRNSGLGTALLRAVCTAAAARGQSVSLSVALGNPAARLYHRLGFRLAEGGDEIHQRMVWRP
ncbi:GNAT family N-acetyltransferase [Xanthobacter sp. DSM 24535]|uniref:GNAT family N-acetyltransferase n=1 Tax=Roseixanthobacter psychrophilus TaxID=3119917 RepID=UPI00372843EF